MNSLITLLVTTTITLVSSQLLATSDHQGHEHGGHGHETHGGGHDAHGNQGHAAHSGGHDDHGSQGHAAHGGGGHDDHGHNDVNANKFEDVGLQFAISHLIHQSVTSYGRLSISPEQTSHVRARFSGVIVSVAASIGDVVKKGDLLAEVESNESLKKYSIRAPIAGTIIQRHANAGEITQQQVLFSISNFDELWVDFHVHPTQHTNTLQGKNVFIKAGSLGASGNVYRSKVQHVLPAPDGQPYVIARVKLPQITSSNQFYPGVMVEGKIVSNEFGVELAVDKSAIVTMEGKEGVFVLKGKSYTFQPLVLGRKGDLYVEVLSGLEEKTIYVNKNAFIIKADIQKSEAEHVH